MGPRREGRVLLKLRTVFPEQEAALVEAMQWRLFDSETTETVTDGAQQGEEGVYPSAPLPMSSIATS